MRILHLYQWKLKDIEIELGSIKSAKWDAVLVGPIQESKEEDSGLWCMPYQVIGMNIGNRYGSKEDLISLCNKAHEKGINIFVDTVITHYANAGDGELRFTPHNKVDKVLVNNKHIWREKKPIDYNSRWSVIHHCNNLAAIRTDNYDYQDLVIKFYNNLIECGIDGVRIDSAKIISLPEEDGNNFFPRVLGSLQKQITVFGEVIFESEMLLRMYQKYIYPLTNLSNQAYNIDRKKEITYFESHDFYLDEVLKCTERMSEEEIKREYKYLLNDFPNVLYYSRPFSEYWRKAND